MTLEEVRKRIDSLDLSLRELLLRRTELSREVAGIKRASGNLAVYRPDREEEILNALGSDLAEEERRAYLPVVAKVLERSRNTQYALLYGEMTALEEKLFEGLQVPEDCGLVRLRLTRPDRPSAAAEIIGPAGDAGCAPDALRVAGIDPEKKEITYEITLRCDLNRAEARKLMLQLSMESREFRILEAISVPRGEKGTKT